MEFSQVLDKLKCKFDEVELFIQRSKSYEFELKNSKDFSKGMEESGGAGIRAIKNGREIFLSAPLNSEKLNELIDEAESAIVHSKVLDAETIPKIDTKFKSEEKTINIDEKEARNILEQISKKAKNFDKRIVDVKSASIHISELHYEIKNSHGLDVEYTKTYALAALEVLAEDKVSDLGYYHLDSDSLDKIDFDFLAEKSASLAVNKLYPKPIQTKKYSVIISNNVFRDILAHYLPIFNGYSLINHTTPLEGKLNEQVFSDNITIIDSASLENRPNSIPIDEEGNKREDTVIIENGVLTNFMHNTYTSNKLKLKNTFNAKRAGFNSPVKVGAFNLHIKPNSDITRDKLLNMVDGIYITDVMGLHMANTISGEFSLGINGFLVLHGELVSYFKAATFAGNFFEIMKRVIAVSDNLYFSGSVGSPDVAIADCLIGGNGG